jgi:hypothetical protein
MENEFKNILNMKKVTVMQQAIGMEPQTVFQDKHIKALVYLAKIIHALVVNLILFCSRLRKIIRNLFDNF